MPGLSVWNERGDEVFLGVPGVIILSISVLDDDYTNIKEESDLVYLLTFSVFEFNQIYLLAL